jgi:hypothetical protein
MRLLTDYVIGFSTQIVVTEKSYHTTNAFSFFLYEIFLLPHTVSQSRDCSSLGWHEIGTA